MINADRRRKKRRVFAVPALWVGAIGVSAVCIFGVALAQSFNTSSFSAVDIKRAASPVLDTHQYDVKMLALAHVSTTTIANLEVASTTDGKTLSTFTAASIASSTIGEWPTRARYPQYGALLPDHRIVAYYGNYFSTGMGILGEFSEEIVLEKLKQEIAVWNAADPTTPVIPAIDYIALTAQASAGKDGFYMLRMPDEQIDHAIEMAHEVDGIVILDVQVGLSNLERELPLLEPYLRMPQVHLAIDPEFSMHNGAKPGTVVGSYDARDINYAAQFLAQLVDEYKLPPKVLIVHRFTTNMVTNYRDIQPLPQVQIVMDMDGWGNPEKKFNTYRGVINSEPVQFTGFKIFYKNDLRAPSTRLVTPEEILQLMPTPSFIQYQ